MQVIFVARRVFPQHIILQMLCCLLFTTASVSGVYAGEDKATKSDEETQPLTLDLSEFYHQPNRSFRHLESFSGLQTIDDLPFQIDGQVRLYGKTPDAHGEGVYSDTKKGIKVGRKFEELHLIHHTTWPDVEGETVAYVCLNYVDGTEYIIPIRYGVHVRDWFNLPSYEKETVSDPDTTVCWRRAPVAFKAPVRIFKSRFENPSPDKVVETMDIVSARNLAAYNLLAATVANRTIQLTTDRHFDGKLLIRVVDDATGKPIAGALVLPGMHVLGQGVVGSPFYTSTNGGGFISYPRKDTMHIFASVEKEGYRSQSKSWPSSFTKAIFSSKPPSRSIAKSYTFRLKPEEK